MYIENNIIKNQISIWLIFMFCLVALMIIIGGLTRLTDSGLSITKWELFSGNCQECGHGLFSICWIFFWSDEG